MIIINPKYESLRTFLEHIPDVFESEGTYIYGGRRNLIKSFEAPDGTIVNVKRFHKPHGLNLLVYSFGLRKPKGQRAYEYPARLQELGIETPERIAYMEFRYEGLLGLSYFMSVQCSYSHLLYEAADMDEEQYRPLAMALAQFAAHIHSHNVLHRDFSPGNILWDMDADGIYHFSIVDINRMRFDHDVSIFEGCKNFARLWGCKQFFSILAREYGRVRGFDADECERLTLQFRAAFWRKYSKKHDIGRKFDL